MSDATPSTTPEAPATPEAPRARRWYKAFCWPTADHGAKPTVYTSEQTSAANAVAHAEAKINAKLGEGAADKWTITVQRTTTPKGPVDGGEQ